MNDDAHEITITITVSGDFGRGNTTREVKISAKSEDEVQILLDNVAEFIRKESGNSY